MLLQRRIRDEQIIFSTKLLTEAQISAFPAEMRQAVSNLMSHAIDAVGAGGKVDVIVEESQLKDSRPAVALTVSDNGPGIAQENLPRLFRPFFTTKGEQGTGLGLWITHGIVVKHGGHIDVASKDSGADHGTQAVISQTRRRGPLGMRLGAKNAKSSTAVERLQVKSS